LRSKALGASFRRQEPIGRYVVDFVCYSRKVIVEVDGGQHAGNEHDRVRDAWLGEEGFTVLRFWNNDVLQRTDSVIAKVVEALGEAEGLGSTPLPASPTRGEG
jgi:very-short-patch-repair endonuclease